MAGPFITTRSHHRNVEKPVVTRCVIRYNRSMLPTADTTPLGLIGLGLMGQALASRLIAAGFAVVGFDLDAKRREELSALGGTAVESINEVFASSPRCLLSLPDHTVVEAVLLHAREAVKPSSIIIDTTTGDPASAIKMARDLRKQGAAYVDAAISGSSAQVERGEVLVMAGGDAETYRACEDIFPAFAQQAVHTGPSGSGTKMKLVTNLVLGLNRAALAEGLAFAESLDLDLPQTLHIMQQSMAYSRIMDTKGAKMIDQDFTPQARLAQHLKDVRLMLAASPRLLPMSEAHRQLLKRAVAMGLGDLDNSAIIQAIREEHS